MDKFGQAEYNDFVAKVFADKLDEILKADEKKNFTIKNAEDMYRNFPSSKDVV
jgi:hypothetical protein